MRYIVTDPGQIREHIHRKIIEAVKNKFPIETANYIAEVSNLEFKEKDMVHNLQRNLLMRKGNLYHSLFGTITIKDKKTNNILISVPNVSILNLPLYTNRYTMIIDGNEYTIVNQMRTKPGVYTRKRGNDEIESSFNLAKGANFKLVMDPTTGIFKINILNSTLIATAVLKILGAQPQDIIKAIGEELYIKNNAITTQAQIERARNTLYEKFGNSELGATATAEEKDSAIKMYFNNTEIDPETTQLTLGNAYTRVTVHTILDAMKKILKVYNEEDEIDERDNLEFQKVYSVEDILKEVIDKNNDIVHKIKNKLASFTPTGNYEQDKKLVKAIFSPVYFTKPIRSFISTSSISRLPTQINPVEIMDSAAIITRLGEGAISSEESVPEETRQVNYSYTGIIDPIATPESSKVGIDNRVTVAAIKGDDNEFYKKVLNVRTGKIEIIKAINLYDKYVGFPDTGKNEPYVQAIYKSKLVKIPKDKLDYRIVTINDLLTITSSSIPFINAIQGNRVIMGDKHVQQALPLKEPDKRLVSPVIHFTSALLDKPITAKIPAPKVIGSILLLKAPVDGVVSKIDDFYIYIKDKNNTVHKVDYAKNIPLATKTLLDNTLRVKIGDTVTAGQILADSNYTNDEELALGKNLNVAYMPYYGMNHEDGVVISDDAAKKLTSVHAEKVSLPITRITVLGKDKYTQYFPTVFTEEQLSKVDEDGVVKKGTILNTGDPIILALENDSESRRNQVLGLLHKSFIKPYRDISEVYDEKYPAEVLEVQKSQKVITVLLKIEKPAQVGDKLAGSYGNKGVITMVVPTDKMPRTQDGTPMDILFTPVGVIGRINPAQILETALGKIATKTGKRYDIENFAVDNYVDFVKNELGKHGIPEKETLIDPETGKKLPNVFTGVQHIYKLFKTTDTNFAARGIEGPHDIDESPVGSGDTGPKALGGMEVNALLAHNARNILKESTVLRGSKNSDFWRLFQIGGNPSFPTEKKTFTRFTAILKQAGIKMERDNNEFILGPLTDKDIISESSGEISTAKRLEAKNMSPENDGLFDPAITGGLAGTKWAHVTLAEPVINPVFEDAVKLLLDVNSTELHDMYIEKGAGEIKKLLNKINVEEELHNLKKTVNSGKLAGAALDKAVKKIKVLEALKSRNLKPGDAYILSMVPVIPPIFRPITISKTGEILENDSNILYRDLILLNNSVKNIQKLNLEDDIKESRKDLYQSVKELTGVVSPTSIHLKNRGVKGALEFIAGDQPKTGYFQRKVIYGKMNLSGRATIIPDKTLDIDQVGLPVKMAWELYKPFVLRELAKRGYSILQAREEVENKTDIAQQILLEQMENRPILFNRAPTLHRHNIVALKPVLRESNNLHINSIIEKGLNADYDGDACTVHLPVTPEAVEEAKNLLPSKLVFTDKKLNSIIQIPTNEPIIGLYKATENVGKPIPPNAVIHKFNNVIEAWQAYYRGEIKLTDYVDIKN